MNPTPGASDLAPIGTVGVIGAGVMGTQLALHIAAHGHRVAVVDRSSHTLGRMRREHEEDSTAASPQERSPRMSGRPRWNVFEASNDTATWRLVSFEIRDGDGQVARPLGRDAVGSITYAPDGHMAVQFGRADRAHLAVGDWAGATPAEIATAARDYFAYCGSTSSAAVKSCTGLS